MVRLTAAQFAAVERAAGGNKQRWFLELVIAACPELSGAPALSPRRASGLIPHLTGCKCKVCKPDRVPA